MPNDTSSLWQQITRAPRHQQALAFLRVATGLYFLYVGLQKFNNPHFESTLSTTLTNWAQHNPLLPYQGFLKQYAIPHASQFAQWVTDGELAIGFSYILGLLIRFSAPLAIFLNLNFLLASQHLGESQLGVNIAFIIISVALYMGEAGCAFGLDSLRTSAKPKQAASKSGNKRTKKLDAVTASFKKAKSNDSDSNDDDDDDSDSGSNAPAFKNHPKKSIKARLNPF